MREITMQKRECTMAAGRVRASFKRVFAGRHTTESLKLQFGDEEPFYLDQAAIRNLRKVIEE